MMREETQKACEDKKKLSFIFMSSSSTSLACALRDVVIIVVDFLCVFFWLNAPLHTSNIIVHYREMQSAPITEKLGEKIQLTPSPFARTC